MGKTDRPKIQMYLYMLNNMLYSVDSVEITGLKLKIGITFNYFYHGLSNFRASLLSIDEILQLIDCKRHAVIPKIPSGSTRIWDSAQEVWEKWRELVYPLGFQEEDNVYHKEGYTNANKFERDAAQIGIFIFDNETHIRYKRQHAKINDLKNFTDVKLPTTNSSDIATWIFENRAAFYPAEEKSKRPTKTRRRTQNSQSGTSQKKPEKPVSESPTSFGTKMTWYALRCSNPSAVADALDLADRRSATWNEGIDAAYQGIANSDGTVFVSPAIGPWVLAIGYHHRLDLQTPVPPLEYNSLILDLSKTFGEAHFYGTHRTVEWHAWAKAENGDMKRAYSYVGDQGEIAINIGRRTREELQLEMKFDGEVNCPNENDVLNIAAAWSVDPTLSNIDSISGQGIIGKVTA